MSRNTPRTKSTRKIYARDTIVQWRPNSGIPQPWVHETWPYKQVVYDIVVYGPNYPDYQQRIAAGQSATTGLDGQRFTSKAKTFYMSVVGKPAYGVNFGRVAQGYSQLLTFPATPDVLIDSIAEREAASRLLKSYLKASRAWFGGAAIAEFRETVKMLAGPVDALYGHTFQFVGRVGRLKKVWLRDPVRYSKLLGQLWLAWAFGAAPLVDDVNGAHNAIVQLANKLGLVDTFRIFGQGENRILGPSATTVIPFSSYAQQEKFTVRINQVKYLGAVRAKPPGVPAIAESFGVGLTDILPAVWEGVPWSWLFDYFVNVNEMLEGVKWATADVAWMNRTVRNRNVTQVLGCTPIPGDEWALSKVAGGGQGYAQCAMVNRVATGIPYPSWQFQIPGMPRQFANVAALYNAIRKSKPNDGKFISW